MFTEILSLTDTDNIADKHLISCTCCKTGENYFVNLLCKIFQAIYDKIFLKNYYFKLLKANTMLLYCISSYYIIYSVVFPKTF